MKRALILLPLLAVSCASEFEAPQSEDVGDTSQASLVLTVTPLAANSNDGAGPQAPEYAYAGSAGLAGSGLLVVYLHGNGGSPGSSTTMMQHANSLGFFVVGLSYTDLDSLPGSPKMADICGTDDACPGQVHAAMFECQTGGPITVPARACVTTRLNSLLHYLVTADPAHNWTQFLYHPGLSDEHALWPKIVLAGHSLGASQAAYGSQHRAVRRTVMTSCPGDDGGADWLSDPLQPGPDNAYGLVHFQDQVAGYTDVVNNWTTLGLVGRHCVDSTCVNPICSPFAGQYCGAHQLTTFRAVSNAHNAPASDTTYAPAWTYMFTHNL